jgi:hypothetical protein
MAGGIPQEHPPCWRQTPRFAWAVYTSIFFDAVSGVFFFNTDHMVHFWDPLNGIVFCVQNCARAQF